MCVMHVTSPDVLADAPDTLDLSHLRGCGSQPGEEELPEGIPLPINRRRNQVCYHKVTMQCSPTQHLSNSKSSCLKYLKVTYFHR